MIGEGTVVKVLLLPIALFVAADVVPQILNSGAQAIIVTAAVIGGLGVLGRLARRSWRNCRDFINHVRHGLEVIFTVPDRLDAIEARLEEGDKRFEAIADADVFRIKDALAGDERSPVDRRSTAA